MDFLESDINDLSSCNSGQPSGQIDLSFSQDIAFDRDVDDLFQLVYSDASTTNTQVPDHCQIFPTQMSDSELPSPQPSTSSSPSSSSSSSSSTLKSENVCDATPPIYSVLSSPETQLTPPEPSSSSRKRKIEIVEFESEIPVQKEKTIKRRERNRESAAASRQRKKDHTSVLESHVRELKQERVSINREISFIEGQNQAMREEITHISTLVTNSPLLSSMWNRYNENRPDAPRNTPKIRHSPAVKAAYFLFLVLFCAFNSSSPMETQTKIAQPLLSTYFNFLATDGNHLQQEQLQGLMDIWLSDPFRLDQSGSEDDPNLFQLEELSNSLGDIPDFSELLSDTQTLLMNGPGNSDFETITTLNPSLYQAVVQVANSAGSLGLL